MPPFCIASREGEHIYGTSIIVLYLYVIHAPLPVRTIDTLLFVLLLYYYTDVFIQMYTQVITSRGGNSNISSLRIVSYDTIQKS